ncbi:MAG: transcription elongation factor GreA [Acidiferrobacterales bacterium]
MSELVPMSKAGYEKIKAQVDRMENEEMSKVLERLAAARAEGDLKENAEYHGARESQGMLQAKINQLRGKLASATIVDPSKIDKSIVAFGATVVVNDLEFNDEETYTLVGAGEEDYDIGKINVVSPVGRALVGKKVGDKVEVEIPKGTLAYEILKIDYME